MFYISFAKSSAVFCQQNAGQEKLSCFLSNSYNFTLPSAYDGTTLLTAWMPVKTHLCRLDNVISYRCIRHIFILPLHYRPNIQRHKGLHSRLLYFRMLRPCPDRLNYRKSPKSTSDHSTGLLVLQLLQSPDCRLDCDSRSCAAMKNKTHITQLTLITTANYTFAD